jgi:hypothetical protein
MIDEKSLFSTNPVIQDKFIARSSRGRLSFSMDSRLQLACPLQPNYFHPRMTPKYKTNLSPKNNSTETSPRSTKKAKVQLKVECLHLLVSKIKYRLQSDLCCEFRNSYAFRNWRISVRMIVAVPVLESNSQVQFDLTRILWRLLDLLSENCLF